MIKYGTKDIERKAIEMKFVNHMLGSTAKKSFSFYPKFNFPWHNLSHWKTTIFEQITRKMVDLKVYG